MKLKINLYGDIFKNNITNMEKENGLHVTLNLQGIKQ